MASITTWVRLEPRARDADLLAGVEARLHDPLWLLARQWQLGELTGTDRGSAVIARTRAEVATVDAIGRDETSWTSIDPAHAPVDGVLAPGTDEQPARPELYRRGRAGRQLVRMLGTPAPSAVAVMLSRFPFALSDDDRARLDAADQRFLASLIGRVPDADRAAAALAPLLANTAATLPATWGIAPGELAAATQTCRSWLTWVASIEPRSTSGAWESDELAYQLRARALGNRGFVLRNDRHLRDSVRWCDLDVDRALPAEGTTASVVSTSIPSRARYRGMPARRYWELEDGAVHWPGIDAGPGDVARVLFVEYGLAFGEHWHVVPLELPVAALSHVVSLVVTDTFGGRTVVRSASDLDGSKTPWRFLELARPAKVPGPQVFVLPTSTHLSGRERQAFDLARDDVADVLWAVDRTLPGADGRQRDVAPAPQPVSTPATASYRVGPAIDPAYHAYRPRLDPDGLALALTALPGAPTSRPDLPPRLRAHAVPARAIRIATRPHLVRTSDGGYHVVVVHARTGVVAPPAPGLTFDAIVEGR